jgi:hypothetical protein
MLQNTFPVALHGPRMPDDRRANGRASLLIGIAALAAVSPQR